jgi:hypothetical protein
MRPIQAVFDPAPLVRNKRTTIELRITSTFPANKQIEVRLTKNNGGAILALLTDENGQQVGFTNPRIHLTVHPGSNTYYWPASFSPLIDFPTINLNDILPDENPWCVTITLNPGPDDNNSTNNSATSCFTTKETRPLPTLIVAVGSTTPCPDLAHFEGVWHDLFLATYPIPEFPEFRGVQIENGRELSTVRCSNPVPLPEMPRFNDIYDVMVKLDQLRTGTDYANVIGVTQSADTLPGINALGLAPSGSMKGVWVADNVTNSDSAVTGLQEIAHTYGWVTPGAPNECASGHLCNVPAPGYWVARDAPIAGNVIDFMHPYDGASFRWISDETYDYLLGGLPISPEQIITEVRATIHNDRRVELEPWYQFKDHPDVALGDSGNLVFRYLNAEGKELARTGTKFEPDRLSDGRVLDRGHVSLRIPAVTGTARIQVTLNGKPLFERKVSRHVPAVRLLSPRPGLVVNPGDRVGVDWEGSDPDPGDHLSYSVFVRRDRSSPWIPLTIGTTNTHLDYSVPTDFRVGPALVRVMATDGINTDEAISTK